MLKVQVSPFIGITEWTDSYSGITFSRKAGVIDIPDGTDLTGIKKNIRLNQLIFVGGNFVESQKAPEPKVEEPKVEKPADEEQKAEEPVEETPVVEEPEVEEPAPVEAPAEEPVVEAPKPKKKGPAKKKTE